MCGLVQVDHLPVEHGKLVEQRQFDVVALVEAEGFCLIFHGFW